jgi:hypothetical protein
MSKKPHLTISNTEVPFCGYSTKDEYSEAECKELNSAAGQRIAQIILAQLGGSAALKLMVSAYNFSSHSDEGLGALSFRFKGSRKANYIKIILAASDTYSLRFGKVGKFDYDIIAFEQDVYCDQLVEVFTRVTGLELRVPRIVGFK